MGRKRRSLGWRILVGGLFGVLTAGEALAGMLEPELTAELQTLKAQDKVGVIVFLKEQADLDAVTTPFQSKAERRQAVIEALQRIAATQAPVLALLAPAQATGVVEDLKSFWIFNGFSMKAPKAIILAVAARPEVAVVVKDRVVQLPPPLPGEQEVGILAAEWNIAKIKAPEVWALGFKGSGVVVAGIDTGVFKEHPDLVNQYRGGTNSWFDAVNGQPNPYDDNGHGTHTMGTIVGRNAGGSDIGVAPLAQWIACKGLNAEGSGTSSQLLTCMQWVLDPDGNPSTDDAPDVVNNSWGTAPGCFRVFEPAVHAWLFAGIFPNFSAGNSGPRSRTGGSPAVYPYSFAVGATDISDGIAGFSSRGPSSCDRTTFPEVSAPGVNIRSAVPTGSCELCDPSGYRNLNGTSMAAPHVAGCVALMLSAKQGLPHFPWVILEATAQDLGPSGPDNTYGFGRIDCLAAVNAWK